METVLSVYSRPKATYDPGEVRKMAPKPEAVVVATPCPETPAVIMSPSPPGSPAPESAKVGGLTLQPARPPVPELDPARVAELLDDEKPKLQSRKTLCDDEREFLAS